MKNLIIITVLGLAGVFSMSLIPNTTSEEIITEKDYPKSLADFDDFKNLVAEVESHRAKRLIDLDDFLKMSKKKKVVVLDTRSEFRYKRKHLKGAIHLGFNDFTQENLLELIPDQNTKILIYCNNNFEGDQVEFASKVSAPPSIGSLVQRSSNTMETQILSNRKPVMLALNIPTYINLYGYGYKNIYELDELVNINDSRIEFEGTEVD